MTRTLQLESRAERIAFELERFEPRASGGLEVSGRWFGVRGRRFVRPTLTLFTDEGAFRALADLEHKPWAPEEGGPWEAAFPWDSGAEVLEAELAVAPDVTIALPPPAALRKGRRRDRAGESDAPSKRDAALADLDQSNAAREATLAELQAANATREAATAARDQALAERDQALAERDQALLERDQALVDLEQERQWREHAARDQDAAQR